MGHKARFWLFSAFGLLFLSLLVTTPVLLFDLTFMNHYTRAAIEDRIAERTARIQVAQQDLDEGFVVNTTELAHEQQALVDDLRSLNRDSREAEEQLALFEQTFGVSGRAVVSPREPRPFAPSARPAPYKPPPLAAIVSGMCGGSIALCGLLGALFLFGARSSND